MSSDFASALKKLEKEKLRLTTLLANINAAIDSLNKVSAGFQGELNYTSEIQPKKIKTLPYADYNVVVPIGYYEDLTIPEMLIYALDETGGAFAHDAAEYIGSIDELANVEYLKKRFTEIASSLAKVNKIGFKKIGKKYKYFLLNYKEE
ncbi:hypothetical protein [Mucilaginibacter ginkgonis]|uniref:Uncharacterized protein n=1 Tax=Mucilaginibacter ginkgonis TaxID=2682091 RepID=A0A6I4I0A7_9SPHI|nr:hypothetical protein [Mucilaginibacter ginkgonis]QQL48950.1 hypothetical protein GO620_012275 [Mucilaginibacter ginkgonis]